MRYKTFFRLVLKAIGIWITAQGVVEIAKVLGSALVYFGMNKVIGAGASQVGIYILGSCAGSIAGVLLGLYLFFRGGWIVNLAIPSNRPYCHECGYELTGLASEGRCPECGTAFRRASE